MHVRYVETQMLGWSSKIVIDIAVTSCTCEAFFYVIVNCAQAGEIFISPAQPTPHFGVIIYIALKSPHGGATINDNKILDLYWSRNELAIEATKTKFGRSLHKVAYNILLNNHDAEECVSDTMHRAWEAIPPKRPEFLGAYLSKITRNLSLKRWRAAGTQKRGGGQAELMLSELADTIPISQTVEGSFEYTQTVQAINDCLRLMDADNRIIFVRRYFFGDSIQDLCQQFKSSESKIKSTLFRARQKLKLHLEKEGVTI